MNINQYQKTQFFLCFLVILLSSCATPVKSNKRNITVIAHRGASGYLPEHTLESVALAHSFNVHFIEADLVMTRDNHLIVMHDIYLDTTTDVSTKYPKRKRKDGRYYAIDFTLKEVKKLRVTERTNLKTKKRYFEDRFPLGAAKFEVPTFIEFIEMIGGLNSTRRKNIGMYVEIKHPAFHLSHKKDITRKFIKTLRNFGYDNNNANIIVQCFDPKTLKRLRNEFKTSLKLVQLIADNSWGEADVDYNKMLTDKGMKEISSYAYGVGPWISQLIKVEGKSYQSTNVVSFAHKYGLVVHPYTHRVEQIPAFIKSENDFFHLLFDRLQVDGIFSDFSDRVVQYLSTSH